MVVNRRRLSAPITTTAETTTRTAFFDIEHLSGYPCIRDAASSRQAGAMQQLMQRRDRKAHHVRVGPLNSGDEPGGEPLDGVGAGFVHRFTGSYIPVDFVGAQIGHPDR